MNPYLDPLPVRAITNALVSPKTSVAGILVAIGPVCLAAREYWPGAPDWIVFAGALASAIGAVLLGTQARDGDATSQDHHARPSR